MPTYYHGTDLQSAINLLGGEALNPDSAAAAKIDGAPGFYLATLKLDAEHFAVRRGRHGGVLQYNLSVAAVAALTAAGAILRPIPTTGDPPFFDGKELYIPPAAFDLFNLLRAAGDIVVTPV